MIATPTSWLLAVVFAILLFNAARVCCEKNDIISPTAVDPQHCKYGVHAITTTSTTSAWKSGQASNWNDRRCLSSASRTRGQVWKNPFGIPIRFFLHVPGKKGANSQVCEKKLRIQDKHWRSQSCCCWAWKKGSWSPVLPISCTWHNRVNGWNKANYILHHMFVGSGTSL